MKPKTVYITKDSNSENLIYKVKDYMLPYPKKKVVKDCLDVDRAETLEELGIISIEVGLIEF